MSVQGLALPPRRDPSARRSERALWIYVAFGLALVLAASVLRLQANPLLAVFVAGLVVVSYQRVLLAWQTMLGTILIVILFIPIRRYEVAGNLPIQLEPYRVVIALVLALWFCALAADPNVRWRKSGLEKPVLAVVFAIVLSIAANPGRAAAGSEFVIKQFSFFTSYLLMIYFIASVIRTQKQLDLALRLLVIGGTVVAVMSLIEWRTGGNLFNWYGRVMPFLKYVDEGEAMARGTGVRARGSAQHPIALGVLLVMLLPLTVYLRARDKNVIWLACGAVLALGALATGSRTGALMLVVLLLTFLAIQPRRTARLLPMLLPLVIVIQGVMPGTLGTFKSMLNPSYVIKEQSFDQGGGAGRIADLGPALKEWSRTPLFGQGFGTRVTDANAAAGSNAQILDNQWLGILLEMGAVGAYGFFILFAGTVKRLARAAKQRAGADAWLPTALAASLTSYAVGMFTFDAFAFIQAIFMSFTLIGLAGVALRVGAPAVVGTAPKPARRGRSGALTPA